MAASSADTLQPLLRCHMQFDSGARGRSGLCSCDMKASCAYSFPLLRTSSNFPIFSGAIGAWIKNIDGDNGSEMEES